MFVSQTNFRPEGDLQQIWGEGQYGKVGRSCARASSLAQEKGVLLLWCLGNTTICFLPGWSWDLLPTLLLVRPLCYTWHPSLYGNLLSVQAGKCRKIISFLSRCQVNKACKHFYDCWDLMTLTVINGLVCLLEQVLEDLTITAKDLNESTFLAVVEEIFMRINLLGRWTEDPSWGSQDFSSDEFLMFSLGRCCKFLPLVMKVLQISCGTGFVCWLKSRQPTMVMVRP